MNNLKNFILSEDVRISHAERYLSFLEKYHAQMFLDIKHDIESVWVSTVNKLANKYQPSDFTIQELILRNPKATTQLEVSSQTLKLSTPRNKDPLDISLSVKLPYVFSQQERSIITKELLKVAEQSLQKIAHQWKPILNFEHKGKLNPWFKIVNDSDEVRFQLSITSGSQESYKTLYAIRVEYGKFGSKLKDFDRIYLTSLV